jgi:hypothetical protein
VGLSVSSLWAQFSLSGKVTNQASVGIVNVKVDLYDLAGNKIDGTATDGIGNYSLLVPAGTYNITFDPPSGSGLAPKMENNFTISNHTVLNETLLPGFTLSGQVTDNLAVGVDAVDINVIDANTGNKLFTPGDNTDINGNYSVVVPSGTYDLTYGPPKTTKLVAVTDTNIAIFSNTVHNVTLNPGFLIDGTVTDNNTTPVPDVDLDAFISSTGAKVTTPGDNTDNNGIYSIVVPGGTLDISYDPLLSTGLAPLLLPDVVITKDTTINVTLFPGITISGQVKDPFNTGVPNVDLDVIDTLTQLKLSISGDVTDQNGNYSIRIPVGDYDITYEPLVSTHLVPQKLAGLSLANDTTINISLSAGVILSGKVSNQSSQGIPLVDLNVTNSATQQRLFTPSDNTDASGNYALVIPAGTYDIDFNTPTGTRYVAKLLSNQVITSDKTLNVILSTGFYVSGKVSDPLSSGVASVRIGADYTYTGQEQLITNKLTDGAGNYQIVLPSGLFRLSFDPPLTTGLAGLYLYNVNISKDTVINVTLPNGVSLSGTVTNVSTQPILNVDLDIYTVATGLKVFTGNDNTDSNGNYLVRVAPQSYHVVFNSPEGSSYASPIFRNVNISANAILNATLQVGRSVSGLVKDSSNTPAFDVDVRVYEAGTPNWIPTPRNSTDSSGFYQVYISSGSYDMIYDPPNTGIWDSLILTGMNITSDTVLNVVLPYKPCSAKPGDANSSGGYTLGDVVAIVNYIFGKPGWSACPSMNNLCWLSGLLCRGDWNGSTTVTLADVIRGVNYIFNRPGGPWAPVPSGICCLPI